jgi:predicted  nucleic acid-binding Zn-ribbon protein
LKPVSSSELCSWLQERVDDLLQDYRLDLTRHIDRIMQAIEKISESSDLLLQEVVIDGELTVPGAASKLSSQLKTLGANLEVPDVLTHTSVRDLLESIEELLRGSTLAGRRYIPRLPKIHKKIIKELDYQIRTINQEYQKIRKIADKNKLPQQLDSISEFAEELEQKTEQLSNLIDILANLRSQKNESVSRIEEQQEDIEHFRVESGLVEIEKIRREIDAIRMLVMNQLNFLKKPLRKLSQSVGSDLMVSSTAVEGADKYSADPWQAFQEDSENLEKLKAGLSALADAIQSGKIKFKQSIVRKVIERETEICEKAALDKLRQSFSSLDVRRQELKSGVSVDERRELEKTLERVKWEHRDIKAEIEQSEEKIAKIVETLRTLKKKIERELKRHLNDEVQIEFPEKVHAILEKD